MGLAESSPAPLLPLLLLLLLLHHHLLLHLFGEHLILSCDMRHLGRVRTAVAVRQSPVS